MRFIEYLNESINDKGILKAVFFAGSPGAGKSTVAQKITSGQIEPRIVNTDKPYEFLVHSYGGTFSGEQDVFVDQAIRLTKKQLAQYINGMLPLYIDGTSNNTSSLLARAGILESFGYDVGMLFVETDLETALQRAAKRERVVPPEFIKQAHQRVMRNKQFYSSKFGDKFFVFNNTSEVIDDNALQQMFKQTYRFFTSQIENPVGQELISKMRATQQQYLVPRFTSIEKIESKLDNWYS